MKTVFNALIASTFPSCLRMSATYLLRAVISISYLAAYDSTESYFMGAIASIIRLINDIFNYLYELSLFFGGVSSIAYLIPFSLVFLNVRVLTSRRQLKVSLRSVSRSA